MLLNFPVNYRLEWIAVTISTRPLTLSVSLMSFHKNDLRKEAHLKKPWVLRKSRVAKKADGPSKGISSKKISSLMGAHLAWGTKVQLVFAIGGNRQLSSGHLKANCKCPAGRKESSSLFLRNRSKCLLDARLVDRICRLNVQPSAVLHKVRPDA
ncbi:unnamed protein product [Protopolystoma xenopodis]|uniref:Uncharacterized protein n=1 Tax=Protopolystoma xenopodis TaxID=117903 RepID=A0A3S5BPB2_9PLAT|nr:unnamed protein product [Protopolystoma xenopodis]